MCKTPPTVSLLKGEGEEQVKPSNGAGPAHRKVDQEEEKERRGEAELLDRDWGSSIPAYISSGCLCTLVFLMGITMRGIEDTLP
jgi:hypothetical protein